MKRLLLFFFLMALVGLHGFANVGLPYFVNYDSETYNAHKRNFDIVCDSYGTVYVANFEGLLYYDQAQWRIIRTPGMSRITTLYRDIHGRIWVGGYNFLGFLTSTDSGNIQLQSLVLDTGKITAREISSIWEADGKLLVKVSNENIYEVKGETLEKINDATIAPFPNLDDNKIDKDFIVNRKLHLKNGWTIYATSGKGLVVYDHLGNELFVVSEENGLCSNNVTSIALNPNGGVWGSTDNGVFCIDIPSVYSHYTSSEGLKGEVVTILNSNGKLYVGTLQGLFIKNGNLFKPVLPITQVCWQLQTTASENLLAATGSGLYLIDHKGIKRLTEAHTISVLSIQLGLYYTGEMDAVYLNTADGKRERLADIAKVVRMFQDNQLSVWAETLYGQIWCQKNGKGAFQPVSVNGNSTSDDIYTLFKNENGVNLINSRGMWLWNEENEAFQVVQLQKEDIFPQYSYYDVLGRSWFTDSEGRGLYAMQNAKLLSEYRLWLNPLKDLNVRAINVDTENNQIWIGGAFGLLCLQSDWADTTCLGVPEVFIRNVIVNQNLAKWGGYINDEELRPNRQIDKIELDHNSRNIQIYYSTNRVSALGKIEYRYRLNENEWSEWATDISVEFNNLWYGFYTFQVEARSIYGIVSPPAQLTFTIRAPLYLRWFACVCYVIIFALLLVVIFKLRIRRLLKEKVRLEGVVEQRTSELRKQNEEIEEKSNSLEQALNDLGKAQNELIRQEKMAMVGTLTKGLIDRILNPMNYINNFSRLTVDLVKDLGENLENEKDNITKDTYEDSLEVLDMVRTNIEKIENHGVNTTRILKAMEEMLKERSGNMTSVDISAVCRKNFEMLNTYYASEIKQYGIQTKLDDCHESVVIEANADQISKTIMSLLRNSVYAVMKKSDREKEYQPIVKMSVDVCDSTTLRIRVYDNGVGIEETIVNKIFDPFFTTKTTGEAAGVGLYLSREIVQNHRGDITVKSNKDEYCEFTISLPIMKLEK